MGKYSHIVWDWNGTLLDDAAQCCGVINTLLERRELRLLADTEEYRRVFRFPVREYYESIGFNFEKEPFADVAEEYMALYRGVSGLRLHSGVRRLIKSLSAQGYTQILLSASNKDDLITQLECLDAVALFHKCYANSDIYAEGKIETVRKCMSELLNDGLSSPSEALFIGDTEHDAEAAACVGADVILLAYGHQSKEELLKLGVPVLDDLSYVMAFLSGAR
jgi:phosphoglycolate phosphatase